MKFTFAPETRPLDGYTIKRAIHRGGFGEVYYALSDAGKEVALKLLNNNLDVELRGVSQCLNLKHPNLVTIFDIREDADADHWIVMEFVGGRGLYDVLRDHPSGLPLTDVLWWLSGIVAGLSFLHDRGIVHRDLKPANVFSDSDIVKIGDVGLSKYISESRRSAQTQSVGTVYYMAPEVARGRYGREVDIYALGVMLVEMLTGRVPFDGETTAEILMKHLTAEPDLSGVPQAVRPVLAAALEKDPAKRTADAEELERQFRLALQDSTTGPGALQQNAKQKTYTPSPESRRQATSTTFRSALDRGRTVRERSMSEVTSAWQPMLKLWNERIPTPAKWVICGALFLLIINSGVLGQVAAGGLVGGMAYLAWRTYVRMFGRTETAATQERDAAEYQPVIAPAPSTQRYGMAAEYTDQNANADRYSPSRQTVATVAPPAPQAVRACTPATIRRIPAGQRAIDITSSLSIAMLAVLLVTTAVHFATDLLPQPEHVMFFGSVNLLAAWALMVPAKLWEGKVGDSVMRRMTQASLGAGVGAAAWMLKDFLMLTDHVLLQAGDGGIGQDIQIGRISLASADGLPTIAGYMVFFAILFGARRWWWQIDSFRKSRFRISSSLVTLLLGAILTAALPFPEALGATWALAISAVVQLSAGWTPHEERRLIPSPDSIDAPPSLAQPRHPAVASPTVAPHATT